MESLSIYTQSDKKKLTAGQPPDRGPLLREITVGIDFLTDFIDRQYFDFYIPEGGSKIKFLTGRAGSGKTHFARLLLDLAEQRNFLTVNFSATEVWMHDFREVYLEILRQCNLERILEGCAQEIIREMGYNPDEIRGNQTFMDFLSERNEADALTKNIIRGMLRERFSRNRLLDNAFAGCCSLLVGGLLGHPVLEPVSREMILAFLHGDKTVKLSQMRAIGISPSRINRYNARHLLRSLAEVVRMAGYAGIMVAVDDMEVLQRRSTDAVIRYTKMRREDAYESIRQLIDDIDSMRYVFFLFSFDRELIDDENYGLKSYQALWFRIQNEVIGTRFNRFTDIIDLDRLADQVYTPEVLVRMSEKLATVLSTEARPMHPLTEEAAGQLIERSQYGGIGLPFLVNRKLLEGDEQDG